MRSDYQPIFRAANSRLAAIDPERCRELELIALRAVPRPAGPRPPMMRELVGALKAAPADQALQKRCHQTLRRIYASLQGQRLDPEQLRIALTAYLDGQGELAARWLTLDVLLRPWGEP